MRIGFLGLAAALVMAIGACSRPAPVSIASHVWVGYEPMFLARTKRWLDEDLVELHETASASDSLQALAQGDVDGAALTLDEVLLARAQGIPLTIILVFNISVGADVILARVPLDSLSDLQGQRVGFEHGAVGELMIVEALRRAGLSLSDIESVDLPSTRQVGAWEAGQVDVIVSYEPVASQLRALGAVDVFDSREIPEYIVDVLAVRSDRLDGARAPALRHLVAMHLRALDHLQRNPQDSAYRMSARLGLPAAEVLPAFRGLVLPDAQNNYRLLHGRSPVLLDTTRELLAFKIEHGLLDRADSLDGLVSSRYLPPQAH